MFKKQNLTYETITSICKEVPLPKDVSKRLLLCEKSLKYRLKMQHDQLDQVAKAVLSPVDLANSRIANLAANQKLMESASLVTYLWERLNYSKTADNSQETADNSQETADNSQENALDWQRKQYTALLQILPDILTKAESQALMELVNERARLNEKSSKFRFQCFQNIRNEGVENEETN